MTRKIYKSAMGKSVDLGALLLQNEHVRAVGNMNVNARGDVLDSADRVIDQKNRQVQRRYQRTATNVSAAAPVHASSKAAKQSANESTDLTSFDDEVFSEIPENTIVEPAPVEESVAPVRGGGGLAAAIARSRTIKQEKELTLRERAQQQKQPIKKI